MIAGPPRLSPDTDFVSFADALEEVVPVKIKEAMDEMDTLTTRHDQFEAVIMELRKQGELDEFGVYFWTLYNELQFADYDVYKKWLQYWLGIFEKLPGKQVEKPSYIDPYESERILQRAKSVPIENFYTDKLRGTGSRLTGRCPFHEEKTASFFIFTGTNTFHCFGCQKNGDVIDFIMLTKKLTFQEALAYLK